MELHMSENRYKYLVRLPQQLRDRLAESAEYYRRSLNSDIIARLHLSFSGLPGAEVQNAIAPPLHNHIHDALHPELSREEQLLVRLYRGLPVGKRAALMDLLS
jgi:hypothetical protein